MMAAETVISLCCGLLKRHYRAKPPQVDTGAQSEIVENVVGIIGDGDPPSFRPFPLPIDVLVDVLTSLALRDLVICRSVSL